MPVINRIHNEMYTDTTVITYGGKKLNYKEIGQAMDGLLSLVKKNRKDFKPGVVYSTSFTCRDGNHHSQNKDDEKNGKPRFRKFGITVSCDKDRVNFIIEDGEIVPYEKEEGNTYEKEKNKS